MANDMDPAISARGEWRQSSAHVKARLQFSLTAFAAAAALVVAIVILANPSIRKSELLAGMLLAGAFVLLTGAAYVRLRLAEIHFLERVETRARAELEAARKDAEETISQESSGLSRLFRVIQAEMEERNLILRRQADTAHRNNQVAMVVGLLSLLATAAAVLALPNASSKYALSAIGIMSAAVSAYNSKTFLAVYKHASSKLTDPSGPQSYLIQFLASNLAVNEIASPALRDQAKVEIIKRWLAQPGRLAASSVRRGRALPQGRVREGVSPTLSTGRQLHGGTAAMGEILQSLREILQSLLAQQGPQALNAWADEADDEDDDAGSL